MRSQLKHRLVAVATGDRYRMSQTSDMAEVRRVLASLKPVATARPLIRIGPDRDGGYLVPDDLSGIVAALSPGISAEDGFDLALAERGIDVFMADASVHGPPRSHPRYHFHKVFLGAENHGPFQRIDSFAKAHLPANGDLILQMDIEGSEWPVLLDASAELMHRFRIIVIELHQLDQVFHSFGLRILEAAFARLARTHRIVHLHPNNAEHVAERNGVRVPKLIEMTLLRRDRGFQEGMTVSLPHPLDSDCITHRPGIVQPRWW
ncbi:MAG: FkbM family methyltransferase [Pseudomonadota bacterium]